MEREGGGENTQISIKIISIYYIFYFNQTDEQALFEIIIFNCIKT